MFKADGTRREFAITKPRVVVGRTSQCDLRIPLSSVSRQHCELSVEDDRIALRDLGSSNGTFHNDTRVQEAELQAGDEITIGPVVFTVVVNGQPEVIEPVRTIVEPHNDAVASPDARTTTPSAAAAVMEEEDEDTVDFDDPIRAMQAMAGDETEFPSPDQN